MFLSTKSGSSNNKAESMATGRSRHISPRKTPDFGNTSTVLKIGPIISGGFFDGDGCIGSLRGGTWASIVQAAKDKWILSMFKEEYGGEISFLRAETDTEDEAWIWQSHGDTARDFLRKIRPYILKTRKRGEIDAILSGSKKGYDLDGYIKEHRLDSDHIIDLSAEGWTTDEIDEWTAGFFLADGTIGFDGKNPVASFSQNERATLDMLAVHFGVGKVIECKEPRSKNGISFIYKVGGQNVLSLAKRIVKYMPECGKRRLLMICHRIDEFTKYELRSFMKFEHGAKISGRKKEYSTIGTVTKVIRKKTTHTGYQAKFCLETRKFSNSSNTLEENLRLALEWLENERAPIRAEGLVDPHFGLEKTEKIDYKAAERAKNMINELSLSCSHM